jgi:Notch 1
MNDTLIRLFQPCDSNPCLNEAECLNTLDGGFRCLCEWGWAGKTCEICLTDCVSNPCPANTRCRARYGGGYDCVVVPTNPCPNGHTYDNSSQKCILLQKTQEVCACLNNGECLKNSIGKETCLCKHGFTGLKCEIDIDECALNDNACNGGTCVDQRNAYYCVCSGNQIGLDCINTVANPCTRQSYDRENQFFPLLHSIGNSYIQCTGLSTFIVHSCPTGLYWNHQAKTCANSISLAQSGVCHSYPCKNAGSCVDTGNSEFKCLCSTGYTGELCEEVIDFCASNPCKNNGKCSSHAGGYTCLCPDKIIDNCCCNGK